MFTHERHRLIARLLARHQRMTVREIQEQLAISPATLRRDLVKMEEEGHLVRVHGGVVHPGELRGEASFSLKSRKAVQAKQAIAAAAAARVPDGATVFLDSGTTCLEVGRRLLARGEVRLVTNSVPLLHEAAVAGVAVLAIGGELRPISGALTGALGDEWLRRLSLDVAFLGASGLTMEGPTTTELSEAAIKERVLERAARSLLVADASKWGASAPIRFARWEVFERWITGDDLPQAVVAAWKPGTEIVRVPVG